MSIGKEPAFPHRGDTMFMDGEAIHTDCFPGLTKREYFAGIAMNRQIQHFFSPEMEKSDLPRRIARDAVLYADALIAELSEQQQ